MNARHLFDRQTTLKPIETVYNGDKFRSRLEARYAVFFTELGIDYRYELEGFDLGEAGYYLPDFWLPEAEIYVEIKPLAPTYEETEKARAMHRQSGKDVVILYGDRLDLREIGAVVFPWERTGGCSPASVAVRFIGYLSYCELRKSARTLLTHLDCLSVYPKTNSIDLNKSYSPPLAIFKKTPNEAMLLARQARFEHGRNGNR